MPEIILKNVTKRFGKFVAVDNLNLTIPTRSFITLLGPSGCGKTTTLKMINRLIEPTSGQIILGGRDGGQAEGVHLFERTIGMRDPWRNRMVSSLDTRGNLIIMVRRRGQVIIPKGDTVLQAGDILLINDMDGDPLT